MDCEKKRIKISFFLRDQLLLLSEIGSPRSTLVLINHHVPDKYKEKSEIRRG